MTELLCRWFGHSLGRCHWTSANAVVVTCRRCGHEQRVARR